MIVAQWKFVPHCREIILRAWSMRLALFWGALNGGLLGLAVFADFLPPFWFLGLNVVGYMLIAVARVTKQEGLD